MNHSTTLRHSKSHRTAGQRRLDTQLDGLLRDFAVLYQTPAAKTELPDGEVRVEIGDKWLSAPGGITALDLDKIRGWLP